MKNLILLAIATVSFAFTAIAPESFSVNTSESQVVWTGYKVTGSHTGTIGIKSGSLDFEGNQLTGGKVIVDMSSISCTDLTGDYANQLVGHLKSDDFFNTAGFPEATLEVAQVNYNEATGSNKVRGNLTIKGITAPVEFTANVKEEMGKRVATADLTIDRTKYNARYGSGSFFENLGDKTIYDNFDLSVKLVLNN